MKKILAIPLVVILILVSGCGKNNKTQYFGVEDEAILTPKEFGQTVEAIEKAKKDARSDYQYQRIEKAMEQGRTASETYWACNDEEARAILALARQSAMEAEMYQSQPPPPTTARSFATVDPPPSPESLTPDPPFAGARTSSPEMIVDTVHFPLDSAALTLLVPDRIDPEIRGMSPEADYEIAGHADAAGGPGDNQRLSERRAGALTKYLKNKGVPAKKMTPVGYGEGSPVAAMETDEGKTRNSRAEIRVVPPAFSVPAVPAFAALPAGTTIEVIRFSFSSNKINPLHKNLLDQMVSKLKKEKSVKLEVAGYADSTGTESANKRISSNRARIVADYLSRNGISKKRLIVRGYGEADPFATNATREGRTLNRRVEIRTVK